MKKALSVLICVLIAIGFSFPAGTAFASDSDVFDFDSKAAPYEDYFIPIVVNGSSVTQQSEKISTVYDGDELLVDVSAFDGADLDVSISDGSAVITSEENEITLVDDADVAIINDGRETLSADVSFDDGIVYAPIDDVSALCGIESAQQEGATVYYKPFQSKRLIVEAEGKIKNVGEIDRQVTAEGVILLDFETQAAAAEACEKLSENKNVKSVSGENVYYATALSASDFPLGENLSWGADYIGSPYVVDYAKTNGSSETITVGIVDTGVDSDHPFLVDRLSDKLPANIEDANGHGTHCAGIIADNTPENVKLLPVKGLPNSNGSGSDSDIASAINYAVSKGADIISMSLGGFSFSATAVFKNAIKNAYDAGCVIVVAAGNEAVNASTCYPASSPYCITVGAVDKYGVPAYFSNYGPAVNISAPGVSINSSYLNGEYALASGTSMATPFVAAACATDFVINGKSDYREMLSRLFNGATPFSPYDNSLKYTYGEGIVSYYGLIEKEKASPVIFSVASGSFDKPFAVSLSSETEDAKIYYTLDTVDSTMQSVPGPSNGTLYTEPIIINSATAIRAAAYSDNLLKSITTKAVYDFNDYDKEENYIVDENGCLLEYKGDLKILSVPEYVNGIKVISVGDSAFEGSDLVSVTLPSSVTHIGENAFKLCKQLERVVAKGVTELSDYCFYWNFKLSSVQTGELKSVGDYCFAHCFKLTENEIDLSHLESCGEYAFNMVQFSSLELPAMKSIGEYAFCECNGLITVYIPNIISVGGCAFHSCSKLESVKLDNALELQGGVFAFCESLKTVNAEKLQIIGDDASSHCVSLTDINLPNAVIIGMQAFRKTGFETISLPSARQFDYGVFMECESLTDVIMPPQSYIPAMMFQGCTSLECVPESFLDAKEVGYHAFKDCTALSNIILDNAEYIRYEAFDGCSSLSNLSLNNAIRVENQNFSSESFTTLNIPKAEYIGIISSEYLTEINAPAAWFIADTSSCNALESINAPNLLENIDNPYADTDITADGKTVIKADNVTVNQAYYNPFEERTVPEFSVAINGSELIQGQDYSISFANNIASGNAYYLIQGTGNYAGIVYGSFKINNYNINNLSIDKIESQKFNGTMLLPQVTLSDNNGNVLTEGFYLSYSDNIYAGEGSVTISGMIRNGYTTDITSIIGQTSGTFRIVADADDVSASLESDEYSFTGSSIRPKPIVSLNDVLLTKNTEYTLDYGENIDIGKGLITINFIGDYFSGCKSIEFEIVPALLDASAFSLSAPAYNYTGEEITPEVISSKYILGTDYSVEYEDNIDFGTGVAVITGLNNYCGTVRLYFDISLVNTWFKLGGDWYYFGSDGRTAIGWLKLEGKWYYFDPNGIMQIGRQKIGNTWYLFSSTGVMLTGWQKTDGKWYYYASSGAMQTGWAKLGGKWYFFNSNGIMQSGWVKDSGKWYYMNSSGAMQVGWQKISGGWYYFKSSGAMQTGWLKLSGKWYYFNSSGAMVTGKQKINGKRYTFNSSGVWIG